MLFGVIAAPLCGALLLFALRGLSQAAVMRIGVGSISIAAILTALLTHGYLLKPQATTVWLWNWFTVDGLQVGLALYLDGLSLTMLGVITGVGALIHLYAAWYMQGDPGYRRFFAYMNLFVAAMLLLVLGDNLLSLYFGWEAVGLCSYLLIGFWHHDPANGHAARKAFITTRVGDTLMAIGLFLLFRELGSLEIQTVLARAQEQWPQGHELATACALLLLGGAVGKSAQLPLQTWLPDAMAGPTPVSALIHAATMVTAGVYLIARMHGLFELSPLALSTVGWVGAASLLLASGAALFQRDIKRILAYSTMSQIGYMFLALGAGAYSAAIFHLMTHAFFKALLFMAAGSVILALHHEQDIFRMGGLRKRLPLAFWSFLIGSAALSALPFVSAGFYSKDAILFAVWAQDHPLWWGIGVSGALLTGLYSFRLIFIVFFGPARGSQTSERPHPSSLAERIPLLVLMLLSIIGGFISIPALDVLPTLDPPHPLGILLLQIAVGLGGIALAWYRFGRRPQHAPELVGWRRLAASGWGFDVLYEHLLQRPWLTLARINRADLLDAPYTLLAALTRAGHRLIIRSQTGHLRWYVRALACGLILLCGSALWI